jgi:RNA polymerase sigma-70 factor (ECF subfamily)
MASMYRAVEAPASGGLTAPSALQEMTGTKEAGLLATAKNGETAAFDILYRVHAQKLSRTVRRITRNREDGEDAVQDSFLRAFVHLKNFDGRSTFSTWLTRIGVNSALMILRTKRYSREISAGSQGEEASFREAHDSVPNPEEQYARRERQEFVRKAMADLRPSIRRVLELHALQGHSINETAAEIGVSVSAAKGRLFQAKAALRKSEVLRSIRNGL